MPHQRFLEEMTDRFAAYADAHAPGARERAGLLRRLADALADGGAQELETVNTPNAVVEVVDEATGVLLRRYLELGYQENANGITLSGEDLSGQDVRISFLSGAAIEKLAELRGQGEDRPPCQD